jgi:hypothetical protein
VNLDIDPLLATMTYLHGPPGKPPAPLNPDQIA